MKSCEQQNKLLDKLYYSIREVATHTGVEPHVLRYWESEFPSLRPKRSRAGSRSYRKKDVEEVLKIRSLLHDEGYCYRVRALNQFVQTWVSPVYRSRTHLCHEAKQGDGKRDSLHPPSPLKPSR